MAGIVVKPRARILHGHDWVFASEVLKVFGNPADGDVISLKDGRDHLIARTFESLRGAKPDRQRFFERIPHRNQYNRYRLRELPD